jgi:hypothetical protein
LGAGEEKRVNGIRSRLRTRSQWKRYALVVCALAIPLGAAIAEVAWASPTAVAARSGQLTITGATGYPGAFRDAVDGTVPLKCVAGGPTLPPTLNHQEGTTFVQLAIAFRKNRFPRQGSVNLAHTKDYAIEFRDGAGFWTAGYYYYGGTSQSYGSGALHFAAHGHTGHISATLTLPLTRGHKIQVRGSWHCH